VQPTLGEGRVVIIGLLYVDVAQPGLGPPRDVGDEARRPASVRLALLDAGVGLGSDRHVVVNAQAVGWPLIRSCTGRGLGPSKPWLRAAR
jgi:hypothetical protein